MFNQADCILISPRWQFSSVVDNLTALCQGQYPLSVGETGTSKCGHVMRQCIEVCCQQESLRHGNKNQYVSIIGEKLQITHFRILSGLWCC